MLTIFPEVYKLTYALLDVWNGTGRLPEVNAAMLRLQDTFDEACSGEECFHRDSITRQFVST